MKPSPKWLNDNKMGNIPYKNYKSTMLYTDFWGKIMTKWDHINNKRSHSHLSYSIPVAFPLV